MAKAGTNKDLLEMNKLVGFFLITFNSGMLTIKAKGNLQSGSLV